jgi:hypothetical protein
MLVLDIPPSGIVEYYDSVNNEFVSREPFQGAKIELEHSLYAISKWESKWKIPYISKEPKTEDQVKDYIKCMIITENIPDDAIDYLTDENYVAINNYLKNDCSATKINMNRQEGKSRYKGGMTSDELYCSMVVAQIPFECQYWNLNRLLILLELVGNKNTPPKKMSKGDLMRRNSKLNAARKAKHHTRG